MTTMEREIPASLPERFSRMLTFIRFSHTIFALPFALGSMLVAAQGWPSGSIIALIIVAMVFARTAAMAFNRLADWKMDQQNPRTAGRHRLISFGGAVTLCVGSSIAFIATTAWINPLCFTLAPVALAIIFFYSLTKRFTSLCHFFLGLALGVAPVGAWLAVTGSFAWPPLILATAVLLWVAGFDLIYATQDEAFDRSYGLHSLVVRLGVGRSLALAQILHLLMWGILLLFGWSAGLGAPYHIGLGAILIALFYEHRVARQRDLDAINAAFFTSNAWVGAIFVAAIVLEVMS